MFSDLRLLLAASALALTAGCNTVGGFGQDVEAGGEAITETSQEVEREISD